MPERNNFWAAAGARLYKYRYWLLALLASVFLIGFVLPWADFRIQIGELRSADPETRRMAAANFGLYRDKRAVEPLIGLLRDDNPNVRLVAAASLGEIGDPRAVEPLISSLHERNQDVREHTATALGEIGDRRAVQPLISGLTDRNPDFRSATAKALGVLQDVRAVKPLIGSLRDEDARVRMAVCWALGKIGDADAVEPLFPSLSDNESSVRTSAANALVDLPHILDQWGATGQIDRLMLVFRNVGHERRRSVQAAFVKHRTITVVPLIGILGEQNTRLKLAAAETLGATGDTRAAEPLVAAYLVAGDDTRDTFKKALLKLGTPAVNVLMQRVRQLTAGSGQELDDRTKSANALVDMPGLLDTWAARRNVDALILLLKAADYSNEKKVLSAIAKAGPKAVPSLLRLLNDDSFFFAWREIAETLATMPELLDQWAAAGQIDNLITVLRHASDEQRTAAQKALVKTGSKAINGLSGLLNEYDSDVRVAAAEALGEIGDRRAIAPLVQALADWYAGPKAIEGLRRMDWSPRSPHETLLVWIAERDRSRLLADWPSTKRQLLQEVKSQQSLAIQNALFAAIALGRQDFIPDAIAVLNKDGDRGMAVAFLNCGQDDLRAAAEKWAKERNYTIIFFGGTAPVTWNAM